MHSKIEYITENWLLVKKQENTYHYQDPDDPHHHIAITGLDPQETLRPNAAGTYTEFSSSTEATHWEAVDEAVADGDTSYIRSDPNSIALQKDSFNLPATGIGVGDTINYVRAYMTVRAESSTYRANAYTLLRTHASDYFGVVKNPSTSYVEYFTEYANNPNTTNPWTTAELDALEVGVRGQSVGQCVFFCADYNYYPLRCTQIYALIDYTAAAGVSIPVAMHHYNHHINKIIRG